SDGLEECTDLIGAQRTDLALLLLIEHDRAEPQPHEPLHRVTDLGQKPADNPVAARVQGDFDDGYARCRVDESEVVDLDEAVLEVDSGPEDGPDRKSVV